MVTVDGVAYPTIGEIAREFNVTPTTVRNWIQEGIVSSPPHTLKGLKDIAYFPPDWVKEARAALDRHRARSNNSK